jgi:hypothetical protein
MAVAAAVLIAGAVYGANKLPITEQLPAIVPRQVSVPAPDSNAYWGPRLWRIFHILAEYSDRRDISPLWGNVLRATAQTMPCTKCRTHLSEYLRTHTLFRFSPLMPIKDIHLHIRRDLLTLHNFVNQSKGSPKFEFALLTPTYGGKPRTERVYEAQILLNELKNALTPLVHTRIRPAAFSQWKQQLELLITLISSGPQK